MNRPHPRSVRPTAIRATILALVLALVPLPPAAALAQETLIVTGIVTDSATHRPVADASVVAEHRHDDGTVWTAETRSGEDGTYAIRADANSAAGEYTIDVAASGYLADSQTVTWDGSTPVVADFALTRVRMTVSIAGADRFATAIAASQQAFPTGADCVVIATGLNWPDALGGSALAGVLEAPILLTKPDSLPAAVGAEIVRLKATHAVILGGERSVSASVISQVQSIGDVQVERVAGANRYETAQRVAARVIAELGAAYDGTAFVATGQNFPDALAASPLASAKRWPIYLANPASGDNPELAAIMKAAGVSRALVLGGPNVVAGSVETQLATSLGSAVRLAGVNRYDTAVKIAAFGVESAGLAWDRLAVCTGQNFPDALAGGVLQAKSGAVLVLTPTMSLDGAVRTALVANQPSIFETRFLGSSSALSHAVRKAVAVAVNAPIPTLKVFVDAGHGGADPGAVDGKDDDSLYTEEEDVNLGIALKVRDALVRCGFEVQMSRTDDTYVPLTSRAAKANLWGANALLCIHANAATTPSPRGVEVYYETLAEKTLADAIDPLVEAVSPWTDRGVKYRGNLAVLGGASMPAVLVEYGFITNPGEEALLVTSSYQRAMAEATCMGLCEWFGVAYLP